VRGFAGLSRKQGHRGREKKKTAAADLEAHRRRRRRMIDRGTVQDAGLAVSNVQANANERNFERAQNQSLRTLYCAAGSASGFPDIEIRQRWAAAELSSLAR